MERPIYPLSWRGVHQGQRNNSQQIWNLFNNYDETQPDHVILLYDEYKDLQQTKANIDQTLEQNKEQNNFQLTQNNGENLAQTQQINDGSQNVKKIKQNTHPKQRNKIVVKPNKKEQTQFEKFKRKSIEKYIQKQIPYTRTLPNSAFKKFYNRPCHEAYGSRSTKQGGVCSGDFMKTHNIQPHTLDNKPQFYQTYTSALNHGKRTKLDLEDRWKRIERQLAKNLDYRQALSLKQTEIDMNEENKDTVLKQNIHTYGRKNTTALPQQQKPQFKRTGSLDKMQTRATFAATNPHPDSINQTVKRSKSLQKPICYIYKYTEGQGEAASTRYAKDRHGITCYVDPSFRQNDEAFLDFQKKIKPIYAEPCKPEDVNIDAIRIANNELSKEEGIPRHYLLPNVEIPYSAFNYSRKKAVNASTTNG